MIHDYQRRTSGQQRYDALIRQIVSEVDDVTEPVKRVVTKLPRLIDTLEELVENDDELRSTDPRGGKRYGIDQVLTEMRKRLEAVKDATTDLEWAYDELNNRFQKNVPRT
jgi:acyl carrier protein phosphodiesterase